MSFKRRKATSTELLCQEEGEAAAAPQEHEENKRLSLREEWRSALLLVLLYMLQGVPLGLSMGSMPFLMQSRVSYTQIGLFSLASYPYSLKLLWSPVVDSIYSKRFGRRKSWIVPLQLLSGLVMLWWGRWVEARLDAGDAVGVTALFFGLVLLAATQDIAVDGWALTLLSKANIGYASTCQTVGMNTGYFMSFTIFLALSDPTFCNKYLRAEGAASEKGVLTLSGYLRFWGWVYLTFTLLLALLKHERGSGSNSAAAGNNGALRAASNKASRGRLTAAERLVHKSPSPTLLPGSGTGGLETGSGAAPVNSWGSANGTSGGFQKQTQRRLQARQHDNDDGEHDEEEVVLPLQECYLQLWRVVRLPAVRMLAAVLLTCRLAVLTAEAAAPLKLLEKGATKEALAGLVLITFPTELVSALVAGRWATSPHPFTPWLAGYRMRLVLAGLGTLAVLWFPHGAALFGDAPLNFAAVAAVGVVTSFTSTLMFTALGSFYNRISDPSMGGAYLTLLNTISNLGFTLPKVFIFAAMDWLTLRQCHGLPGDEVPEGADSACAHTVAAPSADAPPNACVAAGGECVVVHDGFYRLSATGVLFGALLMLWLQRVLPRLEHLPLASWRSTRPKEV